MLNKKFGLNVFLFLTIILFGTSIYAKTNKCLDPIYDHYDQSYPKSPILNLDNCDITDDDAPVILNFINKVFTDRLSLNNNNLTAKGVAIIAKNKFLRVLKINHNHIGDDGMAALIELHTLKILWANDNQISDRGINSLRNTELQELTIANNRLTGASLSHLNTFQFRNLRHLDISGNNIGDEGLAFFTHNPYISYLSVNNANITDQGVIKLSENDHHDFWYFTLELNDNLITDVGARALATLQANYLYFSFNNDKLSLKGVKKLAKNPHVVELNLANLALGDKVVEILKDAFVKEGYITYMTQLDLSGNLISTQGVATLAAMNKNVNINSIILNNNQIGDEGARLISKMEQIEKLSLAKNNIHDEGAFALNENIHWHYLNLSGNPISDDTIAEMKRLRQRIQDVIVFDKE